MDIKQGDIFLADLNPAKGHEQAGWRPVLVMQNNLLNQYLSTVIIVPITANLASQGKMTTYFLPSFLSGLDHDSVLLIHQMRTLDKHRLEKKIAQIPPNEFQKIRQKLNFIF